MCKRTECSPIKKEFKLVELDKKQLIENEKEEEINQSQKLKEEMIKKDLRLKEREEKIQCI